MKTRKLIITALLAALICVFAPWSIPIGAVPITLATLAVYISASVIDWKCGTAAVVVYILLGAAGLPVFSGFTGGIHKLVGLTGGYLIGYIPCAIITGIIIDKTKLRSTVKFPLGMILGTVACYVFGTIWFIFVSKSSFIYALMVCVVPFLVGDTIKIIIASILSSTVRKLIKERYHI